MAACTVLINWVYYRPVGHVIEALRVAQSFAAANPDARISLLLNHQAPIELARCQPMVADVFAIDIERARHPSCFPPDLPAKWDYVFTDPRAQEPSGSRNSRNLVRFHKVFSRWVDAGATNRSGDGVTHPPRRLVPLRLQLPHEARATAAGHPWRQGPRLSVLLGAGSHHCAPSLAFWTRFFDALFDRHCDANVILLGSFDRRRTYTRGFSRADIDALCNRFPGIHDAFDVELLVQLALAELCHVHVSPHTGMSFAIQCLGVPWLALSGQQWHEFLLNGVPLLSVFPDCPLYPCFREMYPECRQQLKVGEQTACMGDRALMGKFSEIIDGLEKLLAGDLSYRTAAVRHEAALRSRLGPNAWTIVDWPEVIADDYVF